MARSASKSGRSKQHNMRAKQAHGHSTSSFTKYMKKYKGNKTPLSAYRKKSTRQQTAERLRRHIVAAYKAGAKINGKKVTKYVTKKNVTVYRRYKPAQKKPKSKSKKKSTKSKKKKSKSKKKSTKSKNKMKTSQPKTGQRKSTRSTKKPNRLGF